MNIKQFFGVNSREALKQVRMELGEDAIILSNRAVEGGNRITALKEEDLDAIVDNVATMEASYRNHTEGFGEDNPSALISVINKKIEGFHSNQAQPFAPSMMEPEVSAPKAQATPTFAQPIAQPAPDTLMQASMLDASQKMTEILNEMRSMRDVFESQLTTIAWSNTQQQYPTKTRILNILLSSGFSAALARMLSEKMPANLDEAKALAWVKAILSKNLDNLPNEMGMLDQGGIFALIGPTGVGKTTTTAKLAARYVMKHGTESLGLITTDAYRIGGHEQLRIYGKILGVMVHAVKDEADLKIALNELKNKRTILIDTVGVSQRDTMVTEQIAMLSNTNARIKKLLCLNATSTGETLTDVIRAYKGKGLDGTIITKLDEAVTIGGVLDVIIRGKLKLYYLANGQRVPEDIHLANKSYLIQKALKIGADGRSLQFKNEELPFIMANTKPSVNILSTEISRG
ncbi:MAG: flagellar biosynthesis protein FlhF [Methylotenera sp.]|uniref:flagellar biosynthesis protein FlhF n=1 Tax=Methylotenera sp. TaxID=2051956 RepID=UPI000D47CA99|nr:flagellar biosynthesis protein FlhF [Methylotenera sp.]PPC79986.1 MAG: flagellar biosynthesis protein FlhF [Methylotenera sp.]